MLTNIAVTNLHPHPDNPRRDLGDLSELSESIKVNGVLQNLTVVPYEGNSEEDIVEPDHYTVVIGHRRLAAAQIAGVSELPCIILNMDMRTQIATMLLENMQRTDLKKFEQAQGFQMMLDLGESVKEISEKTGFSETTVRHRVKMLELDPDKFREAEDRGATLQDIIALEKIKDIDRRNEVLDSIGTNSFNWNLKSALDAEKWEERKAALIEKLSKFAVHAEERPSDCTYIRCFHSGSPATDIENLTTPEDTGEAEYFYEITNYGYIQLYRRGDPLEAADSSYSPPPPDPKQQRERELRDELAAVDQRAYFLRSNFIKSYSGVKKHERDIKEFAVRILMFHDEFDTDRFLELLGIDPDEQEINYNSNSNAYGAIPFDVIAEHFDKSPSRVLLFAAYCMSDDTDNLSYHDWQREFEECEPLDNLYDAFEKIGYEMSDEERSLRDGSHKLYAGNGDEGIDDNSEDPCKLCKSAHPSCAGCCRECGDTCNRQQRCRKQDDDMTDEV